MAWRGIHLSRPVYLCVDRQALKLDFKDETGGTFHIPLEDLSYLILDTPEITLSGRILAALAEANTLVLGVNSKHLPVWTSLPWTTFHRQGEVLKLQLETTVPQKKQLWARIIRAKVEAQSNCLLNNGLTGADTLRNMASQIRSGDPENTEARAARFYWPALFPNREFIRHNDDLPNALLNYGYAILRAAIARNLCAIGFIPQIGLHHDSLANAYNLADDLIEPYRPIVDHFALAALGDSPSSSPFKTDHRRAMARLLETELIFDEEIYSTIAAIEVTTASLKHALAKKDPDALKFPTFDPS